MTRRRAASLTAYLSARQLAQSQRLALMRLMRRLPTSGNSRNIADRPPSAAKAALPTVRRCSRLIVTLSPPSMQQHAVVAIVRSAVDYLRLPASGSCVACSSKCLTGVNAIIILCTQMGNLYRRRSQASS